MNKAFEKILERLSNIYRVVKTDEDAEWNRAIYKSTKIVKEVAEEQNNGWIPVSSGNLPSDYEIHEVTAKFSNGRLYNEFAYFDESKEEWWKYDGSGIVSVIAWKEHTELYLPDEK